MINPAPPPNSSPSAWQQIARTLTAPVRIYQQGLQHLPLTPAERALLKLINGFLIAGAASGIDAVAQYLSVHSVQAIDFRVVINVFLTVGGSGAIFAVQKWASARGDTTLADLLANAAHAVDPQVPAGKPVTGSELVQAAGEIAGIANDVVQELQPPAAAPVAPAEAPTVPIATPPASPPAEPPASVS